MYQNPMSRQEAFEAVELERQMQMHQPPMTQQEVFEQMEQERMQQRMMMRRYVLQRLESYSVIG